VKEMKLINPFRKPPPPVRRRRKKSHKWIDRAKAEVARMPSLENLEEDIVVKAAILCTAGNYSLGLRDFKWQGIAQLSYLQDIIWSIEALQEHYPRYLQYARWVAIKAGVELVECNNKGYRKTADDETFLPPETMLPPDMGKLMQEEFERRYSRDSQRRQTIYNKDRQTQIPKAQKHVPDTGVKHQD
jgi:hypothetical protein